MKTVTCSFSESKSIICTAPDTFYQYPGAVFGAGVDGAAGAVFRDIVASTSLSLWISVS